MKENKQFKRILCFGISIVMAVTIALSPLPSDIFSELIKGAVASAAQPDLTRSQEELALGVNVVPSALASDDSFLKRYVRTSGTSLNINYLWKKVSSTTKDVSGASDTLPTGTLSQSSSSKYWSAQYKWTLDEQAKSWLNQYTLKFEAKLMANEHEHGCGDNHWNDAYITIRTKDWDLSQDYGYENIGQILGKTTQKNTLNVEETISADWDTTSLLTYTAKHSGGQSCGGPKVSGSLFYLVDEDAPKVSNVYLASNSDGTGSFSQHTSFGSSSSITGYVVLEFSEDIRMADNYAKKDALTLELEAYYGNQSSGYTADSNYPLTAVLDSWNEGENKMIFKFTIPATMNNGKNTHVYITGVKAQQSFNQEWDLKLYQADGSEFATSNLKATSRITDLAGNSLNWNGSDRSFGTYYFDNVSPTLSSVNMTGSMITADSTKEPTSWEANSTNRGSTFAGVGDKLGFQVYFSETVANTDGMKAVLSIQDEEENPIKLDVSYVSGNCITFKEFTVTEGMQCTGRILISGFEGVDNLSDLAGNKVATNMTSGIKSPNQQIYLDRDKPTISTSATAADGVYKTISSEKGGEYLTFPVKFVESNKEKSPYISMIDELPVQFVIVTPNDSINFTYYMDSVQEVDTTRFTASGVTASSEGSARYQAIDKVSDDVQYYLHVRLDPNHDYPSTNVESDGIYFNGTIYFYVSDWAGNEGTNSFAVKHQVDTEAPTTGFEGELQSSVVYDTNDSGTVTFTGNIWAKDNHGLKNVIYTWYYRVADESGQLPDTWTMLKTENLDSTVLGGTLVESFRKTVQASYTFDSTDASKNRKGEFYLEISCNDIRGNSSTKTQTSTYSFDFTKPTGNYSVTSGSPENPLTRPVITIQEATSNARTIVLFQIPGVDRYVMYDPKNSGGVSYGKDIFEELYTYYLTSGESAFEANYGSWYTDVAMNLTTGECSSVSQSSFWGMATQLFQSYGTLNVTFITAEFGDYNTTNGYAAFSFTPGSATVTTSTIYLANYAKFGIEIESVKKGDEDVKSALCGYDKSSSSGTYPTLDGVALTFKVSNLSDTGTTAYGLGALDDEFYADEALARSEVELYYCGTKDSTGTLMYTWPLELGSDGKQTIVFTEEMLDALEGWDGFKTGWYRLQITVKNLNDRDAEGISANEKLNYLFTEEIYLYIDTTAVGMSIDTYYKTYSYGSYEVEVRDGKENSLYDFNEDTLENKNIILSLAEKADSWKETTYLRFSRDLRTDGMGDTLTENIRIRVRNATYDALNENGDITAVWVDASAYNGKMQDAACGKSDYLDSERMYYFYRPVLVDGYQEGAYGPDTDYNSTSYSGTQLTLPMLEGTNRLICEIVSTNGTKKELEIPVFVYGQAEEWELEYELDVNDNGNVRSATIRATVPSDAGLNESKFYYGETLNRDWTEVQKYEIKNDVNNEVFYLLDRNGNLSERRLTLYDANGNVLDIDGTEPYYLYIYQKDTYSSDVHHFIVNVRDQESAVSAKDLTLTFDTDYSAVLLGLTGEARANNTQQITMSLPLAVDENGEYLKNEDGTYAVWEEYEVGYNGVFRTQIIEESVEETTGVGVLEVQFWFITKADHESQDTQWSMTVNAPDIYGNVTSATKNITKGSTSYLGTGSMINEGDGYWAGGEWYEYGSSSWNHVNIDNGANSDGELGVWSSLPLASLSGYGLGELQAESTAGQEQPVWFALAPMIVADGTYTLTAIDLFGDQYNLKLNVDDFGKLGVEVSFSTTDPTNQPVTITAKATGTVEKITSIGSATGVTGTIDQDDPSKATITVEDNCVITITTSAQNADGSFVQRKVTVANIDKKIGDTYFKFYDYVYDQLTGEETEAYGEVTVYLMCDEEKVYTTNGPSTWTFPMGSKKGDSYTFEYMDAAGNVGTNTVVLPFDVLEIPALPDTEAPVVTFSLYGIRNNQSQYLTYLTNPVDEIWDDGGGTQVFVPGGKLINDAIGEYTAQQFRFVLSIDDASDTKLVVVPAGSAAPTDYSAVTTGSTVDFVRMSASTRKATLTVSKNGAFDVYAIDAKNNVSAITGIELTAIDQDAPILYADYEVGTNPETGLPVVSATFLPENPDEQFELIIPITEMLSKVVPLETGEYDEYYDENGDPYDVPIIQDVIRYYTLFENNGEFTFHYRDALGNLGQAVAMVKGMDISAAIVKSVIWYGTVGNTLPEKSPVVSRDVTAELNMSKPISEVVLHVYDENAENGVGAVLPAGAPVEVSFTGTNIYITYTDNVNYQIVAAYTASASGRKGYYTLPAVKCIDKTAPVIEIVGTPVLASDKRSAKVTFRSNELALLSRKAELGYATEFVWTATTNAATELYFTDKAGNRTVYTLKDLGIDEAMLEVWYSTSADGTDATEDPQADLTLDPGDTFYVKVNKAASAVLNGEAKGDVAADTWTALTLSDEAGLHIAQFTDKNTGDVVYGIVAAAPKDNIAPSIELATSTVVVDEGISVGEMLAAIRTGVTAADDKDGEIDFTVTGYPDTVVAGLYSLAYTATDKAGNSATVYRSLYIMAEGTPILWINGEAGLPYGKVVIKDGETITLRLENLMDGESVIIKYREGIKTSGQMKYYATTVEDMSFSVTEPGHYTIYVRSQDRVEYVTYIYVEDK